MGQYAQERNSRPVDDCVGLAVWQFEQELERAGGDRDSHGITVYKVMGRALTYAGYWNLSRRFRSGANSRSTHPLWRFACSYMNYLTGTRRRQPRPSEVTQQVRGHATIVLDSADVAPVIALCRRVVEFQADRCDGYPAYEFTPTVAARRVAAAAAARYAQEEIARYADEPGREHLLAEARQQAAEAQAALEQMARAQSDRQPALIFG